MAHHAVAIGYSSVASGNYSVALGGNTQSPWYGTLVFGQFNVLPATPPTQSWITTEPLVVIGNGTGTGGIPRTNAVVVRKDAKVRTASTIEAKGGVRVPKMGDLDMGDFDGGVSPATLDLGLKYSTE